jgi:hypothetical protein
MKGSLMIILATVWVAGGCSAHTQRIGSGKVELSLKMPGAHSVILVMTNDTLHKVPAGRSFWGVWKTTLKGEHDFSYFYLVDSKVYLPDCVLKEKDDFGADNCLFSPRPSE